MECPICNVAVNLKRQSDSTIKAKCPQCHRTFGVNKKKPILEMETMALPAEEFQVKNVKPNLILFAVLTAAIFTGTSLSMILTAEYVRSRAKADMRHAMEDVRAFRMGD